LADQRYGEQNLPSLDESDIIWYSKTMICSLSKSIGQVRFPLPPEGFSPRIGIGCEGKYLRELVDGLSSTSNHCTDSVQSTTRLARQRWSKRRKQIYHVAPLEHLSRFLSKSGTHGRRR